MSWRRHRRTAITLMLGTVIGILVSPFTFWLQSPDTQLVSLSSLNPLCRNRLSSDFPDNRSESNSSDAIPPPKYFHNRTVLTETELLNNVKPPHNPTVRRKELKSELASRKLLFVGIVTAKKYLDTRAVGIYRTWGKEIPDLYFFASQPDDKGLRIPVITLPGINDTQYPPQTKVYRMLKYMHDHYINEFDFFMRSDDDAYVRVDLLMELLKNTNPAQDIYMGCPGFGKPADR